MTIARFPVPPIIKTVTVRAAPARAFALFADDFARWWPLARTHTGPDPVNCAIEPRVGGRVFERAADGRETPWEPYWRTTRRIVSPFPGLSDCQPGWNKTGRDPLYRRGPRHQGRADAFGLGTTR